jgi:ribose 1,5-bisphosphokinase PhnN
MDAKASVTAILALQKRAEKFSSSTVCRNAAAAEKIQEAVVLAQRLPGLSEDNLVALYLQADRCRFLSMQAAQTEFVSGADDLANQSREFLAASKSSLLLATAALCRRMDAGTLQPGLCAPLEEAWFVAYAGPLVDESKQALW